MSKLGGLTDSVMISVIILYLPLCSVKTRSQKILTRQGLVDLERRLGGIGDGRRLMDLETERDLETETT